MNFVSRYISMPNNMEQAEIDSFNWLLQYSLKSNDVKTKNGILKNLLVLVINKIDDIPTWFIQNPKIKIINIGYLSKEERESFVKGKNFSSFFNKNIYDEENNEENQMELEKIQDRFIALTDGLSFSELNSVRLLCKNENFHISDMCNAANLYKYGIKENPWTKLEYSKINEESFASRVKGQNHAIGKTLDVIKRAIIGISGLQGSSHNRPKGVLFFAGPTGVGKTETAKTLAEILFGDENCCIRFDMSEYAQSHSDQKLLGAPPGYVGYEAGGQLTNAIKNNPFSVLLFDEIEKAHPSILDKFLQILEDGRMTDGQGNTVYFSESIIIFTSNLGTYTIDKNGQRKENVKNSDEYEKVSKNIKNAIEDYFKITLGRPEILNRIGENIIIFDYIREDVAKEILQAQIDKVINKLKIEKRIEINLSNKATIFLQKHALQNLENGGRGIGNIVESRLINPLARFLFDNEIFTDRKITVKEITINNYDQYELKCSIENVITPTTKNSSLDNDKMKK